MCIPPQVALISSGLAPTEREIFPHSSGARCCTCQLLAPLSSDLFSLKTEPYHPERARYVHTRCPKKPGKPPTVVPARFVVACPHGHLDDFPWVAFVHQGRSNCRYRLRLREGISGEAADVLVVCEVCNSIRSMAHAFGPGNEENLPPCRGRRPHLRDFERLVLLPGHDAEPFYFSQVF